MSEKTENSSILSIAPASVEQSEPLLSRRIKGKFSSQDDLLFEAQQKSGQQSRQRRDDDLSFTEQWHLFKKFIYNAKTKRVLGRNWLEWLYLVFFYLAFFVSIAGICMISLAIFYIRVSVITPPASNSMSMFGDYSYNLAGTPSPGIGMGIRPLPDFETTLITFQANKPETYQFYTDHMQSFLKSYQTVNARDDIRRKECNQNQKPDKEVACMFQPEMKLGRCGKIDSQAALGYDDGVPCILLKLNKRFGWEPQPIVCQSTSGNENSTTDVKCDGLSTSDIHFFQTAGRPDVPLPLLFNGYNIPVTCEGRNSADKENILGIRWEPTSQYGSFPTFFYPYYNQRGYLAPLIGAQFNVSRAVLIMVRCRAWAKNIHNSDPASLDGAVQFELMVD